MQAKILTILLMSFFFSTVFSQEESPKEDIVHFFSKKTTEIKTLDIFNTDLYGTDLTVNGDKLNADKVNFVRFSGKTYANLINVYRNKRFFFFKGAKASVFIPQDQAGKLNIYKMTKIATRTSTSGMSQGSESFIDYYYNDSEFGTVKKANFKNLNRKFKKNKTAYKSLVKYRNLDITGKVIGYTGAAGIAASIGVVAYELATNRNGDPNVTNYIIAGAILAPSVVMVFGSKLVKKPKRKAIEKALDTYNK